MVMNVKLLLGVEGPTSSGVEGGQGSLTSGLVTLRLAASPAVERYRCAPLFSGSAFASFSVTGEEQESK